MAFEDLEEVLVRFARNTTGGFPDQRAEEFLIRNLGQTTRLEDLADTVVAWRNGVAVTVGQIAEVRLGAAVILAVQKQPGANTLTLTRAVEKALAALQPALPPDVKADRILFKQADFIEWAVGNVAEALRDGAILVAIVLVLFLMNLRTTVISLTAILLSIAVTALVFHVFGLSLNTMTLGGLAVAIGELVDDAVIDVENVFRRLRENARAAVPRPALQVVFADSREVRNSIVYATVIVVLVFVPLFVLSGIEGHLFTPLGITYVVSILASLVVSLTTTPVLCAWLLPGAKSVHGGESWLVLTLKEGSARLLAWSYWHPVVVIGSAALLVLGAATSVPFLGRTFLPPFNEGTVTVGLLLPPGTSLAKSDRISTLAEYLLHRVPEVLSTGRTEEDAEGVYSSEIDVDLRPSDRGWEAILADMRRQIALLPGVSVNIGQPISRRLNHLLSGVRAEIAVKIFGHDLDLLRATAEKVRAMMAVIPGVVDLQVEKQVLIPQVQTRLDRNDALKFDLSLNQLAGTLEAVLNGRVVIRLADDWHGASDDSTAILIDTPAGKVSLGLVAEVVESVGSSIINRDDGARRIVALANVQGRDIGTTVDDIRTARAGLSLPRGFFTTIEGQFKAQEEANRLAVLSCVGIFLVLFSHFGSGVLALVIMTNVPLGLVAALWLAWQPLSVARVVVFITLTGIMACNGILKVSHYIDLVRREGQPFGLAMITQGSLERLTPVLMTVLVAALALVPLITAGDAPGKGILHPVAVVIFGSLVSSMLLDKIVTNVGFLLEGKLALWSARPVDTLPMEMRV